VRNSSRWRVRGLELSSEAADMGGRLNKVEITVSALSAAPFAAGRFDCVHVNNVLEHESDPVAALKKVSALLNSRGRMELTVPNGPVDLLPNVTLFRRLGRPVKTRHGGHLFFFTRAGLEAMLSAAGFRAVSFRNFHFKQGMKARGWLPGAYRSFLRSEPDRGGESKEKETLEAYKGLIPPAASWPLYYARYRLRRMFYCPFSDFGADFSVVAEKK
ncbi:MAG TPA: class I SAM-dependent methyltransferase, partial [Elusimicrobiales bacterium]|nr:class I SAM-dependent methyltransferase [Elusimicrobiales bacterium]